MSVKLKKSAQYSLHSTMLVDQIMQIKNTQLMTHLSFSQYFFFFLPHVTFLLSWWCL